MAGHDGEHQENSSGPDLDPNKPAVHIKHSRLSRKREKVKGTTTADVSLSKS